MARRWKPQARRALDDLCEGRKRAPSLAQLAKLVNTKMPDYSATVERSSSSTDRKIPGTRLRIPGAGRTGNRLIVKRKRGGTVVLDHDSSETYRYNGEAVMKLARLMEHKKASTFSLRWL